MKEHLQKMLALAAGWMPDALMVAGAASCSWGARLVYEPAGWVVAGVFALAGGWLAARGAK